MLEDDRGGLEDSLRILSGLVTVDRISDSKSAYFGPKGNDPPSDTRDSEVTDDLEVTDDQTTHTLLECGQNTRIRLAHFTVKEYLESRRVLLSNASFFHLDYKSGQEVLAESCLIYLEHYLSSPKAMILDAAEKTYPLLQYAAGVWSDHSRDCRNVNPARELALLQSDHALRGWLHVLRSGPYAHVHWDNRISAIAPPLYYASALGLTNVVDMLLDQGLDVNASGGRLHNALQVAAFMGHKDTVQILTDRGADIDRSVARGPVNSQELDYEVRLRFVSALQAAAGKGYTEIVQILIQKGANVDLQYGHFNTALQAAACFNQEEVVRLLIARGADVNINGGAYGTALRAASFRGNERVVKVLLDAGADINAQKDPVDHALYAALYCGAEKVVELLIDRGAEIDDLPGAVMVPARQGHEALVKILLDRGADPNIRDGQWPQVLAAAAAKGHEAVVKLLLERGADVNGEGVEWPTALYAAAISGRPGTESILLDHCADVNVKGTQGSILEATFATWRDANEPGAFDRYKEIIDMLVERGASTNVSGRPAKERCLHRSVSESRINIHWRHWTQ